MRRFTFLKWLFLTVVFCGSHGLYALNVELTVKECAGVNSAGYPITTIVPLPAGEFQDINRFRLTDAGGSTVPAQFSVLNRRWMSDKSIANLKVVFMPDVNAFNGAGTGLTKYYIKDDGVGNTTATELSVDNGAGLITIITGPLKFTVKKSGCNILDQVWFDKDGNKSFSSTEEVIQSNRYSGGQFIGRLPGDIQYDADRTDLRAEVEESGPLQTVVRIEALTKYYSPSNHTHGWAIRIYAFSGKPYLKIDYQLQNSAKTKKIAWPLYFHGLNLNFGLNLGGNPTVRAGIAGGNVYARSLGKGLNLMQVKDSAYRIRDISSGDTLAAGGRPDAFLDVDDGNQGVTAVIRHFWRMWPNGLQVDSAGRLQIQLFPEWSANVNAATSNPVFNSTHLYWLQDMQHVYKEVLLNFHATGLPDNELVRFAKTVEFHPVVSLPTAWIGNARASLDLDGFIPFSVKQSTSDARIPAARGSDKLGWNYFGFNGRRTGTAQAGAWPQGGGAFWATENPSDWYASEWDVLGELNIRPQSMSQYRNDSDFAALHLGINYCGAILEPECYAGHINWREQDCGGDQADSAYIAETVNIGYKLLGMAEALPLTHMWLYHIRDAYWITGNPWLKDWYRFTAELRKVSVSRGELDDGISSRGNGHALALSYQSYQVVGDTSIPPMVFSVLKNKWRPMFREQYGDHNGYCCGSYGEQAFEVGFMSRSIINYMQECKETHPQAWADCFQIISGWMDWNYNYANFASTYAPAVAKSYVAGLTLLDPVAWYYWNTGRSKYRDHLLQYITTGIGGGTKDGAEIGDAKYSWKGQYEGRWAQWIKTHTKEDSVPPQAVPDLRLIRNGSQCVLTWTAPADAKRYHIVWGKRPIVETPTEDKKYLNWWAGNAIGPSFKPTPGAKETISFTASETEYPLVYAAVFSWDSAWNLSRISNLGRSDNTPPTAPVGLTGNAKSNGVMLSWGASSDIESGIWWYNVYRNGIWLGSTKELSYTDEDLSESTSYDYTIAAVSGSNEEGAQASVRVTTPTDTEAPKVLSISSVDSLPRITLRFSERLDSASAKTASNYSLNRESRVLSASLLADNKTVVLACNSLVADSVYTLVLNGIRDMSSARNMLLNDTASFKHLAPLSITNTKPIEFIWSSFTPQVSCFIDQDTRMKEIPDAYLGLPLLRGGSMQSKYYARSDSAIAFTSNKSLAVYVMMDVRQKPPSWLTAKFKANGDTINDGAIVVWEAQFGAGRIRIPGGNLNEDWCNYFIVVRPLDSSWVAVENNADGADADEEEGFVARPNPFNPKVSLDFRHRNSSLDKHLICVCIYNMQGKRVAVLQPSCMRSSGGLAHLSYQWDAARCASGLYLASIKTDKISRKIKLLLVK